jgi:hypothetical protein
LGKVCASLSGVHSSPQFATQIGEEHMTSSKYASILVFCLLTCCVDAIVGTASSRPAASQKIFAQTLVEQVLRGHSEIESLEIAADSPTGCKTIAATDPKEIGERCDDDESQPLKTGEPFVEQEGDGFDLTLPLHDRDKKIIAVVGVDFKAASGLTRDSVLKKARQIAAEIELQVPSKDKLFESQL